MYAPRILTFYLLLVLLLGCNHDDQKSSKVNSSKEVELIENLDSIAALNTFKDTEPIEKESTKVPPTGLTKYFYPNMSMCGGALYGYYLSDELIRIESRYSGEFGYSTRNVEFRGDSIVKIVYHEHQADYDKYREQNPDKQFIEKDLLSFADTTYILNVGIGKLKKSKNRIISRDFPKELEQRLIDCAMVMKAELESEKWLVNEKNELVKP